MDTAGATRAASSSSSDPTEEETTSSWSRRLSFSSEFDELTHYIFKYPAKFHPPVARALVEQFSRPGQTIIDPFCGSGTLLVEAAVLGRNCVGVDIDPVAAFVSRVKTTRFVVDELERSVSRLLKRLSQHERSAEEYERRQHDDITEATMWRTISAERLWVPALPNLLHWFRRYVVIDLARLLNSLELSKAVASHVDFMRLCFASILRRSSNADPVPVSGLEVTSHMKKIDAVGRTINPFDLFRKATTASIKAVRAYSEKVDRSVVIKVRQADATNLSQRLAHRSADVLITSPPYQGAVDYYRRHTLEMYWLGLTRTEQERLTLLPNYLGRTKVRSSHDFVRSEATLPLSARRAEARVRRKDSERAAAFRHYVVGMQRALEHAAAVLKKDGRAVFVVGNSNVHSRVVRTDRLLSALAEPWFTTEGRHWYPLKNRYMSYSRHNGADIKTEHVVVLRRRK